MIKHYLLLTFSLFWVTCTPPPFPYVIEVINEIPILTPPEKAVIIPLKTLPKGWINNRETLAVWKSSLPEVLSISPDTIPTTDYWDETVTLPSGIKLPVRRAKVSFYFKTRITEEITELHFVNVDNIYSFTNYEPSHYELDVILKTIKLRDTGFPQLTADDVLKHKVLMEYGTPHNFDGKWHRYKNNDTRFAVRVIDDNHLAIQLHSRLIERQIKQAIQDVYSEEGIELKKLQLLEGFDL